MDALAGVGTSTFLSANQQLNAAIVNNNQNAAAQQQGQVSPQFVKPMEATSPQGSLGNNFNAYA
jgi:hypothetical protein